VSVPRDAYVDVGRAIRQAIARAAVATDLSRAHHRTLEAVIAVVSSYSRLTDDVFVDQLAELAHLHPETVKTSLRGLRDLGVVVYRGGQGRGRPSLVGLPAAPEKQSRSGVAVALRGSSRSRPPRVVAWFRSCLLSSAPWSSTLPRSTRPDAGARMTSSSYPASGHR
jgi:hypothetical protein